MEENSTEDKSKDSAPLDSQSEGTNYFLQYISTPRWWRSVLFWVFLAFHLHSQLALINSFLLFLRCPFSSKNATNSTDSGAKFVFGQNMSERVLVSWHSLLNSVPSASALNRFQGCALSCFQSPPKGESSNEENKDVSAAPTSEPSSQETTPEKGKDARAEWLTVNGFKRVTWMHSSDNRKKWKRDWDSNIWLYRTNLTRVIPLMFILTFRSKKKKNNNTFDFAQSSTRTIITQKRAFIRLFFQVLNYLIKHKQMTPGKTWGGISIRK